MREFASEDSGYKILIGKNAGENDKLLDLAGPEDMWFHLAHFPSPHLVCFSEGKELTRREIRQCAALVKQYSKYSSEKGILIDYLPRKYVVKTKTLGMVNLKQVPELIEL